MKRFFLLVLILPVCLTGCLDLGMNLKIGKDWDGNMAIKMEMLDQMYQMLTQLQGQQMGMDMSLFDEARLRAVVDENGGVVRKFENKVENGIRIIDIQATVPNVRKLFQEVAGQQMSIRKEGDVWVWNLLDNEALKTLNEMEDELLEQQLNMVLPSLTGLKMKLDIQVPQLEETNLKRVNNTTASFDIDLDRDIAGKQGMEAVKAFKSLLEPKYVKFKGPTGE